MFEVGMSALVLKICSEYAKSLGLNFPPCTQQEINAICEWVDKHTIKDMTISQDGYNVTFTFKTENDTTKQFTFTIPKAVDIDELEKVLVGSDTVVIERLENNSGLRVRLSQSVLNDINNRLTKPANPASDSVVTMAANGTVGTKPLSEISGGGKLYKHNIRVDFANNGELVNAIIYIVEYRTNNIKETNPQICNRQVCYCNATNNIGDELYGICPVSVDSNNRVRILGVLDNIGGNVPEVLNVEINFLKITDTVTEV